MFFTADLQIVPLNGRFGQPVHLEKFSYVQLPTSGFKNVTEI